MKKPRCSTAKLLLVLGLLYATYTLVPAVAYGGSSLFQPTAQKETQTSPTPVPTAPPETQPQAPSQPDSPLPGFLEGAALPGSPAEEEAFTLYDTATEQSITVPAEEFLAAAIACEMDLSSPQEALKAQAVATYTYYTRQQAAGTTLTCDTKSWLVYVPPSAMQDRWGEDYEENMAILQDVVGQVRGQILTWQGQPALATYFAISPGSTEAAANVWDPAAADTCPYLQPVASPGDRLSDGYLSSRTFAEDEFQTVAAAYFPDAAFDFSGPSAQWLTEIEYTAAGMVRKALLGGIEVSGKDLRSAFSLRSACFSVTAESGSLTFQVRGWGHGVGMSQAGAVFLAKQGADYKEILGYYYPGTQLVSPS